MIETNFKNPTISEQAQQKQWRPFRTAVMNIPFASLELTSLPDGAACANQWSV